MIASEQFVFEGDFEVGENALKLSTGCIYAAEPCFDEGFDFLSTGDSKREVALRVALQCGYRLWMDRHI